MGIRESVFGQPSKRKNTGPDFPPPKPPVTGPTFKKGDGVIVTTACEDIALHGLTGMVTHVANTGSVYVLMDVDASKLPFRPNELGHRY